MRRGSLVMKRALILNERSKWSVLRRSTAERLDGLRSEQQVKSRMCPLEWMSKCCWNPILWRQDVKSLVRGLLMLCIHMWKSSNSIEFGETVDRSAKKTTNIIRHWPFVSGTCSCKYCLYHLLPLDRLHQLWWEWPPVGFLPIHTFNQNFVFLLIMFKFMTPYPVFGH